jgi:putative ABC transport system permease protein
VTERVAALPGVQAAGTVSYLPMVGLGAATNFTIEGQPPAAPGQDKTTAVTVCENGFFQALKIPLLRGRLFTQQEMQQKRNVVIINDALARQYFPNEDPIGKRVTISMNDPDVPTEIIGIVGDTRAVDLITPARPQSFWPHPQLTYNLMTLTVRTAGPPLGAAQAIEAQIHALDKDQPVSDVRTMEQWVARSLAQTRFSSLLLMTFAGLALLLAAVGIYGVMSYAVSQRTSEIGVRLAVGAEDKDILRMIVWDGIRLAGAGLTIGLVLAVALSRTLTSLLFQTMAADPITYAAVIAVLGAVALLASYLPARRASRIPLVQALRYQ